MASQSKFYESAYGFAEQWPYLRYLGMGAWWGWIWLCYNSVELMRLLPAGQHPWYVAVMYLASTPGIAAVMLLAAVFWRQFTPLIENGKVVVASGVLACIATIVLGYSSYCGGIVTFAVAAVFTGVGTSFLCLKMGQVYGSVAMRESLTAGAVSLIFAAFLYFMGIGIPQDWRIVFIALLPVVSAFLFIMPSDDPFPAAQTLPQEREGSKSPGRRSYRHLVVASALIALTAGVGKGMSSASLDAGDFASIGTIITFSIAIISVLIGLTVNRGDIVRSTRRIYSSLMLLGVAVLLASCFGFDLSYLSIGKESLWMVLSCFMAYMVFRFDFSPVRAFGIGQAVYFLTSTAAWALGGYLSVTFGSGSASMLIAVLFAFLIVLILTFVFTDADLKFILTWHPQEAGDRDDFVGFAPTDAGTRPSYGSPSPSPAAFAPTAAHDEDPESELALHERIARIDPRCGLSSREAEILEKFAQGRSANWIAEDLTISKNTVRSHLRAIYTKLDVHTRQELLDFLKNVR